MTLELGESEAPFSGLRVIFLGTASAKPSRTRNVSSILLEREKMSWMFDCGEGTQIQMLRAKLDHGTSLKRGRLNKIFITHLHGDHVFGLPGLLNDKYQVKHLEPIDIYGPLGLAAYLRSCFSVTATRGWLNNHVRIHEFHWKSRLFYPIKGTGLCEWSRGKYPDDEREINAKGPTLIYEDDAVTVEAAPLDHTVPCLGYVVTEKPRPGVLLASELEKVGVAPGPIYKYIKLGLIEYLPNGMKASDFVGPEYPARKVVILGDTQDSSNILPAAKGCDLLIHESTFLGGEEKSARAHGHSTSRMAARFAKKAEAKHLVLTHFGSVAGMPNGQILIRREASEEYGGPITLAEDLLEVSLDRQKRNILARVLPSLSKDEYLPEDSEEAHEGDGVDEK